jgi:hypothetical protein
MPQSRIRKHCPSFLLPLFLAAVCALATPIAKAQVTLTEVSSTEWDASNGILSFKYDPTTGNVTSLSVTINGTTTPWLDTTNESPFGHSVGFYPLYSYNNGSSYGAFTSSYHLNGYLDIWNTKADIPGTDPLEIENHYVIRANDAGIHYYQVLRHFSGDGAASYGNGSVNFFCSGNAIEQSNGTTLLYQVNTGPNNIGSITYTFPTDAYVNNLVATDPGRQIQAETIDYTNNALGTYLSAPGLNREFITKYNYAMYTQYELAHGYIGANNAFWWVYPSMETLIGGPTKQHGGDVSASFETSHLGGSNVTFAAGQVATRIFGPYYLHFNGFNSTLKTNADLYNEAAGTIASDLAFYDGEGVLNGDGYLQRSQRASVNVQLRGNRWSSTSSNNIIVLSDNNTNMQLSANGYQYWGYASSSGDVTIPDVMPGTYRVTAYILGQWGLYHQDNVVVGKGGTVNVTGTFDTRNFGGPAPVWTIGIPDRSAHEFLNGHLSNGFDNKDYLAIGNYWNLLTAGSGALIYNVASNNYATVWPFTQNNQFYPNLYAGAYGGSTSGINGYDYITPNYVKTGAAAEGVAPANFSPPPWQIQFTTTQAQINQGGYVLLSINLAAEQSSSIQAQLNDKHSKPLKWYPLQGTDPNVRSGVAGLNDYAVFQFNTQDLLPAGQTNTITLFGSGSTMYDALKLEIGTQAADPSISGWPEYDWLYYNASDAPTQQSASAP